MRLRGSFLRRRKLGSIKLHLLSISSYWCSQGETLEMKRSHFHLFHLTNPSMYYNLSTDAWNKCTYIYVASYWRTYFSLFAQKIFWWFNLRIYYWCFTFVSTRPTNTQNWQRNHLAWWTCAASHHDGENVLSARLIVQSIRRVHDAGAGIDPKHPHASRIHAAMDGVAQLRSLVPVFRTDAQDLGVGRRILRHGDLI